MPRGNRGRVTVSLVLNKNAHFACRFYKRGRWLKPSLQSARIRFPPRRVPSRLLPLGNRVGGSVSGRVGKMVADKGKKSRLDEEAPEHVDGDLVLSIEKLQEIQDEIEKVNEEASDKVLEVEQKYNEIRRPIYKRRNEIVQSIPDFWLTAFLSHPVLSDLLCEEDQKIFKYLISLDVEDFKDVKSGYSITLNFSPNPYFEDTSLTKTYSFSDEGTTNITGTEIKWKEGMNIANGVAHGKDGGKRPVAEESFFTWFGETQQKHLSEGFPDEVAEILKEDLWPNPLKYFNNEAEEEDFDGDEDDDEKGADLGEEDESGGDEDDS